MRSWKAWTAAAVAAGFLALLGFGLTRDARTLPSALVGRPAPDFRGETLDGDSLSLADLRGHVVVLNFWASWCGPCLQEHPVLVSAQRRYRDRGVRVVGVVYQDRPEAARRFMQRLGGDWPSVLDADSRIAIDYGISGVPETFFISEDGRVARKKVGPVTWEGVRSTVDSLLAPRRGAADGTDRPGAATGRAGGSQGTGGADGDEPGGRPGTTGGGLP